MNIPFLDLRAQHDPLREQIAVAVRAVFDSSSFAGGPFVAQFENDFAAFCGSRFAVGVGSGTDALWLALLAHGIGPGDEVITVANTFMATAEAISVCGATPVFVDVEEDTYTMDPALFEQAITPRTKAVIPVHLFGQMADMDPILDIARKANLIVIEDACQAHGAEYRGRKAGSLGHAGCFSFYPGKNLGGIGEGGAVITDNGVLAERLRLYRDHGQKSKYHHSVVGWNARMDGIQGAILSIKLRGLARGNDLRRRHAATYAEELAGCEGISLPATRSDRLHAFHLYVVRTSERDLLLRELTTQGIGCGIHYPNPVHLQEAYRDRGYTKGSLPVSERCASEILSLPMYPELTAEQVRTVATSLRLFASNTAKSTDALTV